MLGLDIVELHPAPEKGEAVCVRKRACEDLTSLDTSKMP